MDCNISNCSRLKKLVEDFKKEKFIRGIKEKSLNCLSYQCMVAIIDNVYGFTVNKDGIVVDAFI